MRNKFIATTLGIASVLTGFAFNTYAMGDKAQIANQTDKITKRPILTTAGIVHYCPNNDIILIERGKVPFGYAMFGGHVEHESPEAAFKREAKEELNVDVENIELVGVYGEPGRDPRQQSVEVTYSATTTQKPYAGTDAKKTHLFTETELKKKLVSDPKSFAFDHAMIIEKYLAKGQNPCLRAR